MKFIVLVSMVMLPLFSFFALSNYEDVLEGYTAVEQKEISGAKKTLKKTVAHKFRKAVYQGDAYKAWFQYFYGANDRNIEASTYVKKKCQKKTVKG